MPKGHHGSIAKEKSLVMPRIRTGRKRRGRKLASTLKQKPMAVERKEPQTGEWVPALKERIMVLGLPSPEDWNENYMGNSSWYFVCSSWCYRF